MNVGGHDDVSDGSNGNGSNGDDKSSSSEESDNAAAAEDDRELKEKNIQRNRIKKQHEANKAYLTLFDWYRITSLAMGLSYANPIRITGINAVHLGRNLWNWTANSVE
jgi:hypothetical protein